MHILIKSRLLCSWRKTLFPSSPPADVQRPGLLPFRATGTRPLWLVGSHFLLLHRHERLHLFVLQHIVAPGHQASNPGHLVLALPAPQTLTQSGVRASQIPSARAGTSLQTPPRWVLQQLSGSRRFWSEMKRGRPAARYNCRPCASERGKKGSEMRQNQKIWGKDRS